MDDDDLSSQIDFRDNDLEQTNLTPLFVQYFGLKQDHPGCLLLMRVGDFYEAYGEDAVTLARQAEIILTSKEAGAGQKVPMAGVPFFSLDNYLRQLVTKGTRVAIADQMEDARLAKGLVRREVTRTITAGTVLDPGLLDDKRHNFLCATSEQDNRLGCAYADISTGEFFCTELPADDLDRLFEEIVRIQPAELITPEAGRLFLEMTSAPARLGCPLTTWGSPLTLKSARDSLQRVFPSTPLKALDLDHAPAATTASALLLRYLQMTQASKALALSPPVHYRQSDRMIIDSTTARNLELTETLLGRQRQGSLLWACDFTSTSMGARRLRQWILAPLLAPQAIEERLDTVESLIKAPAARARLKHHLARISDLERLTAKVSYGTAHARDLGALAVSLQSLPLLHDCCELTSSAKLISLTHLFPQLEPLTHLLTQALADDPPLSLKEGGLIRAGYDKDLDGLRSLRSDGQSWLSDLQERERETTGIRSLKIGFNQVFGYFIEVTRSNLTAVPAHYVRKQTLANAERYVTPELKEYEAQVLGADEKIRQREYELFCTLRDETATFSELLRNAAHDLSVLDVLSGFAEGATRQQWVKPQFVSEHHLTITKGRHPVVERSVAGRFVPNSLNLDDKERLIVLTGPNMSGKSTFLRQNALLVIMAQMGCFVPAQSATIGITDRVFTRVGASDDLHLGQSTFMVEMAEAANILRFATPRSLVILDEIGRGTSTYDGMSLAQAMAEYLYHQSHCKTLFATHFHELTRLSQRLKGCTNYRVAVREDRDTITFLHRIVPGGAGRSYGIHVASLAGVPEPVLARARTLLEQLERGQQSLNPHPDAPGVQLSLFAKTPPSLPLELTPEQIDNLSLDQARLVLRKIFGH